MKTCTVCKEEKPRVEFWRKRSTKDGRQTVCKTCSKRACLEARNRDPRHKMLSHAKTRAKRYDLPLDITVEDINIPEFCPVLGIELQRGVGRPQDNSPSLDRIIPNLGYVVGNVEVISYRANTLKRDATPEELQKLYEYYK